MDQLNADLLNLIIFFILLTVGYIFGQMAEKRHFKSLIEREDIFRNLLTFSERFPPPQATPVDSTLVVGSVVISIDYFKKISATLRSFFGGRVGAYESLLSRARREAILRMKEEAHKMGAQQIFNVKLESAAISKGRRGQIGAVEVYAYGTALIAK